jgi:hypothetical protein
MSEKPEAKGWGGGWFVWIAAVPILFATYMGAYYATFTETKMPDGTFASPSGGQVSFSHMILFSYRVGPYTLPYEAAYKFFRPAFLIDQWVRSKL